MNPARSFGRRMRRGLGAATALTALITAVGAGAAASSSAAPSSPPADVVTVQAADGDGLRDHAAALVAEMSTAEQASSIVMGHIGGSDPAALRAYMQSGLGGFILMGGNIPESESELRALTAALTIDPALPR
ncbi:hypothetical protein AB1285_05705 [Microbacterium sp. NRRL B-14842]|uniref:hypothetical protein n=1 Tax=Microbacterium sp. NRRL B-14842 TaxID=3162881 RepID=UPI003511478E